MRRRSVIRFDWAIGVGRKWFDCGGSASKKPAHAEQGLGAELSSFLSARRLVNYDVS